MKKIYRWLKRNISSQREMKLDRIIIEVSEHDVLNAPFRLGYRQTMLDLLKSKGAPVSGIIWLKLKAGYSMQMVTNPFNNIVHYIFDPTPHRKT